MGFIWDIEKLFFLGKFHLQYTECGCIITTNSFSWENMYYFGDWRIVYGR